MIEAEHRRLVLACIVDVFPGVTVIAYGSRTRGKHHRYSDLDLALAGDGPLDARKLAELQERLDDTDLPYRVDLHDVAEFSQAFRERVAADVMSRLPPRRRCLQQIAPQEATSIAMASHDPIETILSGCVKEIGQQGIIDGAR